MLNKKNILFVVHRYYPYPGGSEVYTQNMAEEMVNRGHEVTVLTGQHKCDRFEHNGVRVATDIQDALNRKWDLIIVHGGDVNVQNIVHLNSYSIKSPICYMLIKPSDSEVCVHGMKHANYLACSTSMDIEHCKKYGLENKIRRVRHGIPAIVINKNGHYGNYVSAGGFYPHKAMTELAAAWNASDIPEELHLYGYGMLENAPPESDRVKVFKDRPIEDIHGAIATSNGYIMNSFEEGFGLVLLEAMLFKTPWYARNIAGAKDMSRYGTVYETEEELLTKIGKPECDVGVAYAYAVANHTISSTVNDLEDILLEQEKLSW